MTKYCPKCGAKHSETAKFCPKCGHTFSKPSSKKEIPQISKPAPPAATYYTYALAAALVVAVVISFFYIHALNTQIEQQEEQISILTSQVSSLQSTVETQQSTIESQSATIEQQEETILEQQQQITYLESEVTRLGGELAQTEAELAYAYPFQERGEAGMHLSKAYTLLGDYGEITPLASQITDYGYTNDDAEIWGRAKDVYAWLGNNYDYCSDKGFCVGSYCYQIQFFSPDELLIYSSDDLCGDCDDQATVFAGLMYASGVPHNKVRIECGSIPGGRHCWTGVNVDGSWFRVDPVCAHPSLYIELFGYTLPIIPTGFPGSYKDVGCFSSYDMIEWYTPEGYQYTG